VIDPAGVKAQIVTSKAPICPVCSGINASSWREVFDDRYGHPDLFSLVRCDTCGHLMTTPMLSESELSHLYGTYYPRKNITADEVASQAADVELPFNKIKRWWMGVDNQGQYSARSGEKMLDVGCGSGLSLLEAQKFGVEVWGIEADPNVKPIADALALRIHQGSLHDIPFEGITFDLIVLNQVIEHIPEPDKALMLIRPLLTPGGRVILVFPNVNSFWCKLSGLRWINWHIPYHLHHFTIKTFTQMVKHCGYQVVRSRTVTPNIWSLLQLRAMMQTVSRGQVNSMWSVKPPEQSSSASGVNIRTLMSRILKLPVMIVISIVNRVVDSFGLGDSLIVELRPEDVK
jgi:2-polyprenyl-3-methyl-5-hydroxy-6-metoxy-1,4-benzoquinol methylase